MKSRILVTGGTGRIGLHLVRALDNVRVLVRKNNERINELPNNVEIVYGDLLNKPSLEKAVKGIDIVYHLAAVVDYLAPKDLMWKVNVEGTKNLLEAAKKTGVKKFIYLSSTSVYGKSGLLDENTKCKPTNFYGKTKLEAEKLVLKNKGIVIRSPDVYFPGFTEGYHQILNLLEKNKMPIIGNGKNRIHYIYITDLIEALLLAAKNGREGEVYQVAGPDVKTQEELFHLCCKYLNVNPPERYVPAWFFKFLIILLNLKNKIKKERPNLIPEYIEKLTADRVFDISKAEKELGFKPKVKYKGGISKMIEYYKKSEML